MNKKSTMYLKSLVKAVYFKKRQSTNFVAGPSLNSERDIRYGASLLLTSLTRSVIRGELVRDEPIQERIDFVYDASGPKSMPILNHSRRHSQNMPTRSVPIVQTHQQPIANWDY